jgi:hypothetical protein
MVLPMFPLPMSPMVVTFAASPLPAEPFPPRAARDHLPPAQRPGISRYAC